MNTDSLIIFYIFVIGRKHNYIYLFLLKELTLNMAFLYFVNEIFFEIVYYKRNKSINKQVLVLQILFTGYEALLLIVVIGLSLGALVIIEGYNYLEGLGQTEWIYKILISTMVRDIAPIITAFIILARSGTAISTELGNMVVRKEIAALKAMGIEPLSYLVAPRVLGMILSMILLIFYFLIVGIFGGYIFSVLTNPLPFTEFFNRLINELKFIDIFIMVFKVALSGFLIGAICSYQGLKVQRASTEVPQRTIKAVMRV